MKNYHGRMTKDNELVPCFAYNYNKSTFTKLFIVSVKNEVKIYIFCSENENLQIPEKVLYTDKLIY